MNGFWVFLLGFNLAAGFRFAPSSKRRHFARGNPFLTRPVLPDARICPFVLRMSTREELTPLQSTNVNLSEEQLFAQQYLRKTIRESQASLPKPSDEIASGEKIEPQLVIFTCAFTYAQTIIASGILASLRGGVCWPSIRGQCEASMTLGIVYGLLGGVILRRVEIWRRACNDERDKLSEKSVWKQACNSDNDELLEKGVLLGVTGLSITARVLLQDSSLGEKSVSIVNQQCTDLEKALLQITGSIASCALVHGALQQVLLAQFSSMASSSPMVASGTALAPAAVASLTAAFEFAAYLLVCQILLPMANYEAQARRQGVLAKRKRCLQLFALMGVPREVARLRAEAFEKVAEEWDEQERECNRRREITNFVRVLMAATVYAASSGSILAPVLTNIAVTDSVLRVLSVKSLSK
eukprot:gnl/MRDRNA2_/MRDRNA2_183554_c0_seq1.p1 gnl/MRDRNA2_/MRDRNA2_183554_c0~~gnl/MRDRNA2_/MRDRNA2_183554_c0_seq1.p1  ORF type:complete len:412 (+),score=60.89 gnl/MRDRNA2_/MRDRNA2_183554_c0_seq1:75-1310(+)